MENPALSYQPNNRHSSREMHRVYVTSKLLKQVVRSYRFGVYAFQFLLLLCGKRIPFKEPGSLIQVCMDGCFQLIQKRKKEKVITGGELRDWEFLCNQEEVDKMAITNRDDPVEETEVSNCTHRNHRSAGISRIFKTLV